VLLPGSGAGVLAASEDKVCKTRGNN
jgi:hypothetical protein